MRLGWLTELFGGCPTARLIHLGLAAALAAFVLVHVALVALFPRTMITMVADLLSEAEEDADEACT